MESKALENNETEGKSLDQSIQKDQTPLLTKETNMEKNQVMADGHEEERNNNIETSLLNIAISDLVVRYHPRKNMGDIESLQGSIKRDGLQEPLLVYEDGQGKFVVIDGYRRLTAISEFGWKTIPCLIKTGITADQAAHLSYVNNTERSAFDPIEIALHIKAMRDEFGYSLRDLEIKGYGSPAKLSFKLKLLDLPEKIQKQIQKSGLTEAHGLQLVKLSSEDEQIRWAKRINDDDLTAKRTEIQIKKYLEKGKRKKKPKVEQVPSGDIPGVYIKDARDMCELPNISVDLIVSSPPYFVGKEYEKGMSFDEHLEMVQDVLKECARVLKPGGIMALNVGDIYNFKHEKRTDDLTKVELMGHRYQIWLRRHKIFLTDLIVWYKEFVPWRKRPDFAFTPETVHTSHRTLCNWEPVYIFRKKGERIEIPSEDIVLRSRLTKEQWVAWTAAVWHIKPVHHSEGHPTIYPDELCYRLIKMFSYEGDRVLDPWLGSGTTVKVARELNREAVGYEKEPQYKETIMKKLGLIPENAGENATEVMKENIEMIKESEVERQGADVEPVRVDAEDCQQRLEFADDYAEAAQVA